MLRAGTSQNLPLTVPSININGYGKVPFSFAQAGIPIVIPSSGTIGNNGALSAITALQNIYSSCYMYFPVNTIAAGVAAGFYYVVMSSTTAGTIYNNTYTSGTPVIPASPTPFVTTGPGLYTQTTLANITMATFTVPGGSMGINGAIQLETIWSNSGSANAKTMSINLAATTIQSVAQSTAANISAEWRTFVQNRGAQNVQVFGPVSSPGFGASTAANVISAIDTSVNQSLAYVGQLAVATDFIVLESTLLMIHPS